MVHTTDDHLFWDLTRHAWIEASKLPAGDRLLTADGAAATAGGGIRPADATGWMWDLTVDDLHAFYVLAGGTPVLVHNCGITPLNSAQTELAQIVMKARMEHGVAAGMNVAVYRIGTGSSATYLVAQNVGKGGLHSEEVLDAYLKAHNIDPLEVTGIYSERQPCSDENHWCAALMGTYTNALNDLWWTLNPDDAGYGVTNASKIRGAMNDYAPVSGLPAYTWVS